MRGAEIIAGRAMALALKAPEEARQTLRKVDLNIIEAKNKRVRCRVYRDDTGLEKKGKKRKKKRNLSMLRFFFFYLDKSFALSGGVDLVS